MVGNRRAGQLRRHEVVARLLLEQDQRQSLVPLRHVGVGARHHGQHVRAIGERAPHLRALDQIAVALFDRARFERRRVAARIGFGECGRSQNLAARDRRQEFLFLLGRAVGADQRAGDDVARHHGADAEPSARQLLGDDRHRDVIQPHAAFFGGKDHAEVAELGHLLEDAFGDFLVLAIEVVGYRLDLGLDELADRAPDKFMLRRNQRHLVLLLRRDCACESGPAARIRAPFRRVGCSRWCGT